MNETFNDNNNIHKIKLSILMYKQDDPSKCTAAKLIKFKMANQVKKIPFKDIILDPFSKTILTKKDKQNIVGICALDCSWKLADDTIKVFKRYNNNNRKLPALLAGNPINYAKIGMLSTSEALTAALYILGYKEHSFEIMNKFKWGHTFIELNQNILDDYSNITDQEKIKEIEKEYFPNLNV
jgi:pre-rRNA-processing protein TSR3